MRRGRKKQTELERKEKLQNKFLETSSGTDALRRYRKLPSAEKKLYLLGFESISNEDAEPEVFVFGENIMFAILTRSESTDHIQFFLPVKEEFAKEFLGNQANWIGGGCHKRR